ncbi:uncharacterized protein [Montipora foliosa]|uniref:uncharacterized protein n=1 Tax=Montipora foliosa TaxID=591990 RepID=UPI0035F1F9E4
MQWTILSAIHFNYNLRRENKVDDQGNIKVKVRYPKFKDGEATVREIKVEQNYEYVAEIYETLISTSREDLKAVKEDLDRQTPQALHSMLQNKENKEEAIGKYHSRKQKETVICPPTCSDAELQSIVQPAANGATRKRKTHTCSKCGKPRKGQEWGQCSTNAAAP